MRSFIRQRGQALVELVLATLMFLPLFLLIIQSTRVFYARLQLVSLTRDAALIMIHEGRNDLPSELLSELAKRRRMNPALVSSSVKTSMAGFLLGSKLTVRYHLEFDGPLARLQPEGLQLSETVTLQSNCWKNLGMDTLNRLFSF